MRITSKIYSLYRLENGIRRLVGYIPYDRACETVRRFTQALPTGQSYELVLL
jgi:hypothetical protein